MENLAIDELLGFVKSKFDGVKDKRASNSSHKLGDVLQSGFAMFSLKDASLLEFNDRYKEREGNLNTRFIFVEDALYANEPHIRSITSKGNIRCKEGSGAGAVIKTFDALCQDKAKTEKLSKLQKNILLSGFDLPDTAILSPPQTKA